MVNSRIIREIVDQEIRRLLFFSAPEDRALQSSRSRITMKTITIIINSSHAVLCVLGT